jgi:hypothetical protein
MWKTSQLSNAHLKSIIAISAMSIYSCIYLFLLSDDSPCQMCDRQVALQQASFE